MNTLKINNLHVKVDDKEIIKGLNLTINPGEVHAIMGPNGSGKSTLANTIAGREDYQITEGEIIFEDKPIHELSICDRARLGIFLGFQYPVEIPGVSNIYLMKTAVNNIRTAQGLAELDAMDFLVLVKEKIKTMKMSEDLLYRSVNEGFSGGEKKRNEILQMLMLEPKLAVLDETDSGLDIDALKIVSDGVNSLRDTKRSFLLITHYQRLLDHIKPDFVHVLSKGKIVKSGGSSLAVHLEQHGYAGIA